MRQLFRTIPVLALIWTINLVCATKAPAQMSQSGNLDFSGDKVAIVAGAVAVVAIVTVFVVLHARSGKETITGCVSSGPDGMVLIRDADKRTYVLGGNTSVLLQGHRMRLHVKRTKPNGRIGATIWSVGKSVDIALCGP